MTRNKKIIISTVVVVLLIVLIGVGTIITINLINKNNTKKVNVAPTTKTVNNLRADAEKARASGNKTDAKTLLTQAQQQVNELPKTDANTNTKVDIQAQLYLLEHANK
jgi:uncharacterized membrane protein (DUF106 family)